MNPISSNQIGKLANILNSFVISFSFFLFRIANKNHFIEHTNIQEQMEDDDNSERSFLKRSAFNQYTAISCEMTTFEKELFAKYLHEGTFVVNSNLKKNILKLKFASLPQELKDEIMRKEVPQSTSLSRIHKAASRLKPKSRSSQGLVSALTPRKSFSSKSKFNILSTAVQWISNRPGSQNTDLALAEKLMKASASTLSLKSSRSAREVSGDFKISQAKCELYRTSNFDLVRQREKAGSTFSENFLCSFFPKVNFLTQFGMN